MTRGEHGEISFSKVLTGLGFLALIVNFAAQWRSEHAVNFTSEAARVSFALLHGRGFADPYLTGPSGATAQMAPLYPFVHAALCAVFGVGAPGWAAILTATALAWALQWAYAYRIAAAFGQPVPVLIAAIAAVLLPLPGRFFKWEAVFAGAVLAFCAWSITQLLAGEQGKWLTVRLSLGFSAMVLLTPSTILIWLCWALFYARKTSLQRAARFFIPVFVLALIPVCLWTVRNYRTFGKLFFIRDDAGLVLVSSYDDCATALVSENIASGCFAGQHPSGSPEMLAKLNGAGEIHFAASEMQRTREWISAHPGRSAKLALGHFLYFWFPVDRLDRMMFFYGVLISGLTVCSFGAFLWKSDAVPLLLLVLLPYSLTYYAPQFDPRYRYPVLWISGVLAAVAIRLVYRKVRTLV